MVIKLLNLELKILFKMNSIIKMMPKFITYFIVLQTLYNLSKFKEDNVMVNTYNFSQSVSINVSSQLEFTDRFTIFNYLQGKYIPFFYKAKQEGVYHNILNHPNFTCYSQEMINCIVDSSNEFKYLYGSLGYNHCGLQLPEIQECEKDFTVKYLDTNYEVFISQQYKYDMRNFIQGLCFTMFKFLCAYLATGLLSIIQFVFDFIDHMTGARKLKKKYN